VGHAYGLTGDHREWAKVPVADLTTRCAEALPRVMAPRPAAAVVQADPFASPSAGGAPPMSAGAGMQQAFEVARQAELGAAGVPPARPPWVLAVIVGVAALVLGGGLALVLVLAN
jgi:serine/threonine-protein kinase